MPDSSVNFAWLFGPFVVYLILLIVYYVWEGKREKRLRAQYEGAEHGR